MMDLQKKLNEIRGRIVGLKMEMSLLEQDIDRIEIDLFYLNKMKRDLVYNIDLLKEENIVLMASEYKRSIKVLKEVRQKIIQFKNLRLKLQETVNSKTKQCDSYNEQFEKELKSSSVLQFKKRGQ